MDRTLTGGLLLALVPIAAVADDDGSTMALRAGSYACRSPATLTALRETLASGREEQAEWMVGSACLYFRRDVIVEEVVADGEQLLRFELVHGRQRLQLWADAGSLVAGLAPD